MDYRAIFNVEFLMVNTGSQLTVEKTTNTMFNVEWLMVDSFVKSEIRRICHTVISTLPHCHFDYREKSYLFSMLRFKDFSFHSK